jgi:hypothetical protein
LKQALIDNEEDRHENMQYLDAEADVVHAMTAYKVWGEEDHAATEAEGETWSVKRQKAKRYVW